MAHGHLHHHHHSESSSANIAMAFFLNLGFTLIEFVGGFFTNSLAIMSDALHDLGDSLGLGLAWYLEKKSTKKPTQKYSFGFKRLSLLGAVANSVLLIVGSVFIILEAIPRIIHPQQTDAKGMMWLAILGIIVNGAAVLKLKKSNSINQKVVSLHLLEDVLGWLVVLIASVILQFWHIPVLDPILSLLISFYVLFNIYKNIKESIHIILQGTPDNISISKIKRNILEVSSVKDIHDFHIWTMDGSYNIISFHVVIDKNYSLNQAEALKVKLKKLLYDKFNLEHITIEFDTNKAVCEYMHCS
ncbi:MAG: cation diffusion facilitator family transporter [Tenacibaculum sp.]